MSCLKRVPNWGSISRCVLSRKISIPYATLYEYLKKEMLNAGFEEQSNMWLIIADDKEVKHLQSLKNDSNQDRRSSARL